MASGESPLKLNIHTQAEGEPTGFDSSILVFPERFYVRHDGKRTLLARQAGAFLRELSEKQAGDLGEKLHHAEWTLTTDPGQIRTLGLMHDCEDCRAGVTRATAYLRDNPGAEIAVGQLWWA